MKTCPWVRLVWSLKQNFHLFRLHQYVPYSGKLSREKTFANWWKCNFRKENFHGLVVFATPKDALPQISRRKLSHIATKLQISRKFSPSKVFHYTVLLPNILLDVGEVNNNNFTVASCGSMQWLNVCVYFGIRICTMQWLQVCVPLMQVVSFCVVILAKVC